MVKSGGWLQSIFGGNSRESGTVSPGTWPSGREASRRQALQRPRCSPGRQWVCRGDGLGARRRCAWQIVLETLCRDRRRDRDERDRCQRRVQSVDMRLAVCIQGGSSLIVADVRPLALVHGQHDGGIQAERQEFQAGCKVLSQETRTDCTMRLVQHAQTVSRMDRSSPRRFDWGIAPVRGARRCIGLVPFKSA